MGKNKKETISIDVRPVSERLPIPYENEIVFIKTHTGMFDCVGMIIEHNKGEYDKHQDRTKSWYLINILTYVNGDFSKKEQKYYIHEIASISNKIDARVVKLLYAAD